MEKHATVFGGSIDDNTTKEYVDSVNIGKILVENHYVVRNGGYFGIMEAVSKGASENGGKVYGFTCRTFPSIEGNTYLTTNYPCDDIYNRLRALIEYVDIFIVQKGGIGTLSELFITIDILRNSINPMKKTPTKILLIGKYYTDVFNLIQNILPNKYKSLVVLLTDYREIQKYL